MKILIALVGTLLLSSCVKQELNDYNKAREEISKGHYRIALTHLDKVIKRDATEQYVLESLREAARLSEYEIKDPAKAIQYYRQLVLKSPSKTERIKSQEQIAALYFNNLQDYPKAISEYSKLLEWSDSVEKNQNYRLSLARAYFYLNNMAQSLSDLERLLKENIPDEVRFSSLLLKGNIYLTQKNFKLAVTVLTELMEEYPEKSLKENVGLTLAVCYEENGDFKSAIRVLESYREKYQPKEYIDLRIKRLLERQKNAPGAKGFRK